MKRMVLLIIDLRFFFDQVTGYQLSLKYFERNNMNAV